MMCVDVGEKKKKLVIIQGPTASGKSELAVLLAERFAGEIINADSMQVYRDMDIGTAKPSLALRQRVPHHLLDVVAPDEPFTAADFRVMAEKAVDDILGRGKRPFIVGGTGLYIKALTRGLVDSPQGDESIREELRAFARNSGKDALFERLAAVDPVTAERLHPNDQLRIIRALEVYELTGMPISALHDKHRFAQEGYTCLKIGVTADRATMYRRIEERVDRMLAEGLVEEVESLLARGYPPTLKSMRSLGYKQICSYLAGECTLDEAVHLIKRETRHYAKRQLTWFRKDSEIKWFEYPGNIVIISTNIIEFYV